MGQDNISVWLRFQMRNTSMKGNMQLMDKFWMINLTLF